MDDEIRECHESYGQIGLSRINASNDVNLYGSPSRNSNYIELTVSRSQKLGSVNPRFFAKEEIVHVALSESQLVQLMTSANCSGGVPCTIKRVDGHFVKPCPEIDVRQDAIKRFKAVVEKTSKTVNTAIDEFREIISNGKTLRKAEKERLTDLMKMIEFGVSSDISFILEEFNESMDEIESEVNASE